MNDRVTRVEAFTLTLPRETAYLGPLRPDEAPNARGYLVRRGNRTVYPAFDRWILVRIEAAQGVVGWGETYGIVAPGAVLALIADLYADFVIGRDPCDPAAIHDDLYDLMRVRGYTGGFTLDALAALDIALWDIAAPIAGLPLAQVGRSVQAAVAVGEERRTVHDMVPRLAVARIDIVQPEMGHTGVTEFMRIGALAHAHHVDVIPHATIGAGIFLAASLQCSAALPGVTAHEYQHSIFEPNRRLLDGGMDCAAGAYALPEGPGLGATPSPEALRLMQRA